MPQTGTLMTFSFLWSSARPSARVSMMSTRSPFAAIVWARHWIFVSLSKPVLNGMDSWTVKRTSEYPRVSTIQDFVKLASLTVALSPTASVMCFLPSASCGGGSGFVLS